MINNKNTVNEVEIKYLPKDMTFLIDYLEATSALVKAGELQDNEHTKKLEEILKLYYQKRKENNSFSNACYIELSIKEIEESILPFNSDVTMYTDMQSEELRSILRSILENEIGLKNSSLLYTINSSEFTFSDLLQVLAKLEDIGLKEMILLLYKINIEEYYERKIQALKEQEENESHEIEGELRKIKKKQ